MCAPVTPPATYTPKVTARPHPQAMMSQLAGPKSPVCRPDPGSPTSATATEPQPSSTSTKVPRNSAIISPPRFWRIRTQRPGWRACDRVELIAGLPVLRKSCESVLRGAALVACPLTVGSRGAGNNTIRSTLSYGGYGAGMPGTVQAVERAAAILRLLAVRGTPLALGEIAAALGLAKTTAHGLLRTLLVVDFVSREPGSGRYTLGDTLRHLGAGSVDVNELRSKSMNWADTLASRSGEAVRLATSGDD